MGLKADWESAGAMANRFCCIWEQSPGGRLVPPVTLRYWPSSSR